MKLSFIIPYYKTEKYIDDLLSSLVNLDMEDFEVVIVDDASNDNLKSRIDLYPSLNIKLITLKENIGVGFSRNKGVENVSKNITHIVFLDSDDRISNNFKFEKKYSNNTVYLYGMNRFNKKKLKYFPHNYRELFSSGDGIITNPYIWGIVIPIKIAKKYKFLRRTYEDVEVKSQIVSNEKIIAIDKPMVDYRLRRRSLTTTTNASVDRIEAYSYILKNNLTDKRLLFKVRSYEAYFLMNRGTRKKAKHLLPKLAFWRISLAAIAIFFQKIVFFRYWYNGFNLYD